MNPNNTDQTVYDLAAAAKVILDNEALKRAFSNLEKDYYRQWQNTPATDVSELQAIKGRQDCLAAFRADLEAIVTDARFADKYNKKGMETK